MKQLPLPSRVRLGVNVDHVATLRQARGTAYPDPVEAALIAEAAGADQITVHLREDRRHIQDHDVFRARKAIRTLLNLEMGATDEMERIALEVAPHIVTLVPERREERTTEGGLDLLKGSDRLRAMIARLAAAQIEVSLFIDPDPAQILASADLGAHAIELHTGDFCLADASTRPHHLQLLHDAAYQAHGLGLRVAAGHGLDLDNVGPVAALPPVGELNIGPSRISRAVFCGLDAAIKAMLHAITLARAATTPSP
jgi:pyridoxine 5-phosphate synthase